MKEIEGLRTTHPKAFWNKLRSLSKVNKRRELWDTAIDKEGVEVAGVKIKLVWNSAYEELGKENLENKDFDKEFAREIEEEIQILEKKVKR